MHIPPQSIHSWTALFGGISYSAWALLAYSCWQGLAGTSIERISKGKVPRFFLWFICRFGTNRKEVCIMIRPKLSYIIPVYNVESYLPQCLDSIFSQAVPANQYEVICIDDTSTDASSKVILDYKKKYSNLIYIQNAVNLKAGGTRNVGLSVAKGEYVWFVDADDVITDGSLSKILQLIQQHQLDVLCFNYQLYYTNYTKPEITFGQTEVEDGISFLNNFGSGIIYYVFGYPWRAVYRKELLEQYDAHFPENILYGEETTFLVEACAHSKRVLGIDDILYNYRQGIQSISTQLTVDMKGERIYESIFQAGKLINEVISNTKPISISLSSAIASGMPWFVNRLFLRLIKTSNTERRNFYECLKINRNSHYVQEIIQYMDVKNKFIITYPFIGYILLNILSFIYRCKHK